MEYDITRVGILGMGTMGAGIAQLVAQSGYQVMALETGQARANAGLAAVRSFLGEGIRRGKVTHTQREETLSRIRTTTAVGDLHGSDLVIEAVTEDRGAKRALLAAVAGTVGDACAVVTNTSALSVSDLASAVPNPARFGGLHFFNPAPLMKVIEVVRALQTDNALIASLTRFVESLGKTAVVVKDRPGFLVNCLLMPYLNDVIQEFDDQLASAEDIDVAVRLGLGHKLGPLELLDLIGLDVHAHATESAYQATRDQSFAPPPLLRQMVAAGRLGNKSGHGFRGSARRSA
jgi:3-hydroxybutyryl-CoA dehydrogenase